MRAFGRFLPPIAMSFKIDIIDSWNRLWKKSLCDRTHFLRHAKTGQFTGKSCESVCNAIRVCVCSTDALTVIVEIGERLYFNNSIGWLSNSISPFSIFHYSAIEHIYYFLFTMHFLSNLCATIVKVVAESLSQSSELCAKNKCGSCMHIQTVLF